MVRSLRSFVVKLLVDNIFIERLGFSPTKNPSRNRFNMILMGKKSRLKCFYLNVLQNISTGQEKHPSCIKYRSTIFEHKKNSRNGVS